MPKTSSHNTHTVPLTARYRIAIPKEIRRPLDLQPGQQVRLTLKDGRIILHPLPTPTHVKRLLSACTISPLGESKYTSDRKPEVGS